MALLNITNFDDHPEDPNWLVFRFGEKRFADEFVVELEKEQLRFERDDASEAPYLVGVRQRHRDRAVILNYQVLGRYRSPFIADPTLRWVVLGITFLAIAIALAGAFMSSR